MKKLILKILNEFKQDDQGNPIDPWGEKKSKDLGYFLVHDRNGPIKNRSNVFFKTYAGARNEARALTNNTGNDHVITHHQTEDAIPTTVSHHYYKDDGMGTPVKDIVITDPHSI